MKVDFLCVFTDLRKTTALWPTKHRDSAESRLAASHPAQSHLWPTSKTFPLKQTLPRPKINTLAQHFSFLFPFLPTEAVNLELININSNNNAKKPTNGKHNNDLPAKKDGDVEMGATKDDSYDEYFVPVNKHRKYMG